MPETAVEPVLWTEIERPSPDVIIVRCHGRLVSGGADALLLRTVKQLIPTAPRIVLDLADLKHTDSMGLGTLVRLHLAGRSAGCDVELMHLNKQIRHLLGLTHLLDVFTVIGESGVKFM